MAQPLPVSEWLAQFWLNSVEKANNRFQVIRGENKDWLVLDVKADPPHVVCRCEGWQGPNRAERVREALEDYNSRLYNKFEMAKDGAISTGK